MPIRGEKDMACYTSRTYEEQKQIQRLWEAGAQAKEIADKLDASLSSIYSELRRGGTERDCRRKKGRPGYPVQRLAPATAGCTLFPVPGPTAFQSDAKPLSRTFKPHLNRYKGKKNLNFETLGFYLSKGFRSLEISRFFDQKISW